MKTFSSINIANILMFIGLIITVLGIAIESPIVLIIGLIAVIAGSVWYLARP